MTTPSTRPVPQAGSPELVAHWGALSALPAECERLGLRRILVVAGGACGPVAARTLDLLGRRGLGTFSDVRAHVPAYEVNLAVASAQEVHADAVVSIGGGSATGFGKIIALALRIPLIAVPTTYSGAEMTSRYLVTTDKGKESGSSPRVLPRMVVQDPALTTALPTRVTASSGVTAIASCLNALRRPDVDPQVADWARTGLALLWNSLPELLRHPDDRTLREQALRGAALAGRTLERTGPGLAQLVAEDLGAGLGADHGALLGCLTAQLLAGAGPEVEPARAALRELDGSAESAEALFRRFTTELGMPERLTVICGLEEPQRWARRAVALRPDISLHAGIRELTHLLESA
ncbi:iron-containing alcohol dehydrogenase [Streptomyces sp. NPDC096354]|uniref:iron-containing alcohol dehydrogenase n=1 Tax=Streptomyces sp. NPDC096354 TaxID=3366088 RepID=UPI0037FAB8DD